MSQVQREPYTADDKLLVASLLRAGLSASQIAEQVGRTRNSVIGVVHRDKALGAIGLHGSPGPRDLRSDGNPSKPIDMSIKANRKQGGIKGGQPAKIFPSNIIAKKASCAVDPGIVERDIAVPDARMVPLVDLEPGDCKFPIGDPMKHDFGFCGAPRRPDCPYCQAHRRLAYVRVVGRVAA